MSNYSLLAAPLSIRGCELKNRMVFPPHGTTMVENGKSTDQLCAYHRARAAGGAALLILEGMSPHETFDDPSRFLSAGDPGIVPGLSKLSRECQQFGAKVFGQLFHGGASIKSSLDGSRRPVYGPSAVAHLRYGSTAVPAPAALVWEWVEAYGRSARHLAEAGLDGVEVLASMGYLIAQFLNPVTNNRVDEFGGSFDNRVRFLAEVLSSIRANIADDMPVGIRVSADEFSDTGLDSQVVLDVCSYLDERGLVDYVSVIGGTSASASGWIHVFPPMAVPHAYLAGHSAAVKQHIKVPVLVTGRINQPQLAEQILASGQADMVGMVRAMIADPEFANKTLDGRADEIRACIGCNQACVGHRLAHFPVSCIQHPETGRELDYGERRRTSAPRHVVVVGAGPGGLKTAAVAAQRGHRVTLLERSARVGGQALLAQLLPGRSEFGGLITNLAGEVERAGVEVIKNIDADLATVAELSPDVAIVATGAKPRRPSLELDDSAHVVNAWQVIDSQANVGASVVVADWIGDWIGLGVAEMLARNGCRVRLAVSAPMAGAAIQDIVRDQWAGELHKLGVEIVPYAEIFGADADSAYFTHTITREPVVFDDMETLVLCQGHQPVNSLDAELRGAGIESVLVGDALSPRTAEEAVLEGLKAGSRL